MYQKTVSIGLEISEAKIHAEANYFFVRVNAIIIAMKALIDFIP